MGIALSRDACRAAGLALVLAFAAPSAAQQEADESRAPGHVTGSGEEATILQAPALGELPITRALRIRVPTLISPDAPVGSGGVTLVRPELNIRGTLPVADRAVLRMTMRLAEFNYNFHGDVWGPSSKLPTVGIDPDVVIGDLDLHSAQIGLEGAYRLSRSTEWFAKNEEWGLVSALYAGSRWEDDSFHSGLGAGGGFGIGYEIPDRFRIALGASIKTPLGHADFDVGPLVSLRWRPTKRFTLRSRELGAQAELVLTPVLEVFVAGFRSTDRFRLQDRAPLGDLSFRDRQVRVGAGFEWRLANYLRLLVEAGSIVDRRLRVHEEDLGEVLSRRGDPSGYVEATIELRL